MSFSLMDKKKTDKKMTMGRKNIIMYYGYEVISNGVYTANEKL